MDLVLNAADFYVLDSFYAKVSALIPAQAEAVLHLASRTSVARQCFSLWAIALLGATVLYFTLATLSYYLLFDHENMKHPKFLPNQIRREIGVSLYSFPITSAVTVPWFLFEVRGYSKLYHSIDDYGWPWFFVSIFLFIMFTDFGVYWIHRFEHHPLLYGWLHKGHHAWKVSTPFAAFAFHPLDGYFQSLPMHIFVYLFPMNSYAYLTAFVLIQCWTVSIHDGVYLVSHPWINSAAHHTVHHLEFNYNYGQYFTLWDRIGGSYRRPDWEFENNMLVDKLRLGRHTIFENTKGAKEE
ncbi:c-5 sterol desaturase [Kappamyces sp. JEL0829]|nr:c-5 sterol desaturase [Kappamyces sp. JEL0829]KAJ3335836.1 c-5 sterol desaturase [Kappamyces sp. JEL0680]